MFYDPEVTYKVTVVASTHKYRLVTMAHPGRTKNSPKAPDHLPDTFRVVQFFIPGQDDWADDLRTNDYDMAREYFMQKIGENLSANFVNTHP